MDDEYEEYAINCIGVDDKLHCCLPWEDKCQCGVKVKSKIVGFHDWVKKFSCYECDYSGG